MQIPNNITIRLQEQGFLAYVDAPIDSVVDVMSMEHIEVEPTQNVLLAMSGLLGPIKYEHPRTAWDGKFVESEGWDA